jgi:hypothetical protein
MKGKIAVCWAVIALVCCAVESGAAKKRQPKQSLCSVSEVAVSVFSKNSQGFVDAGDIKLFVAFKDAQGVDRRDVWGADKVVEYFTWLKVVPQKPGVAQLWFLRDQTTPYADSSPSGASVGDNVVFALKLFDESKAIDWEATTAQFEGTTAVGNEYYSRTYDKSTNDNGAWIKLLGKLNKEAHGCK